MSSSATTEGFYQSSTLRRDKKEENTVLGLGKEHVNTREKLITYIVSGEDHDFVNDDVLRYDFELHGNQGKLVATRLWRDRKNGKFSIHLLIQEDQSGEGDWVDTDVEWIPIVNGELACIEEIINDQVYNDILVKMKQVMEGLDDKPFLYS